MAFTQQFNIQRVIIYNAHGPLAKRLMHMVHFSRNTSVVSKSSSDWLNYTGFSGRRVSRSLTFHLETKMLWRQTPSRKKKAVVFTNVTANAYQSRLNAGFPKICEIFKVCAIESLKYIREFFSLPIRKILSIMISPPMKIVPKSQSRTTEQQHTVAFLN